jgi:hypothetical protein
MTLKKSLIAFMPPFSNQGALNEPDSSATSKRFRFRDSLPHLGDEEYAPYAQIQMSPGPMAPDALVAHQAPHTLDPRASISNDARLIQHREIRAWRTTKVSGGVIYPEE